MRKIIKAIFLLVNLLAVACMLLADVAGCISPGRFLPAAYFALAFPMLLFINVAFVLFWVAMRKWYFLLSLLLIVFSYSKIKICFPINVKTTVAATDTDSTFNILTYNTQLLGGLEKHTRQHPNKIIRYVLEKDPDIVCLQEFVEIADAISEREVRESLAQYPYHHIYYKTGNKYRKTGIATFSKYPIVGKTTVPIPSRQNEAICTDIVVHGDTVRLFNCHLESNLLTEKDKSIPTKLSRNFDVKIWEKATLYLSNKLGTAYKIRSEQADSMAEYIAQSPYPVVVCGDFNDVPISYAYTKIRGDMQDLFQIFGTGLGFTFNENLYKFRIDYILCDNRFAPLCLQRDKVPHSDHYPLICTLKLSH